jgi:hypothetical protein
MPLEYLLLRFRYSTGPGRCFFKFNFFRHSDGYSNEHIKKWEYSGFSFPYIEIGFEVINKRYCKKWVLVDGCFYSLHVALDALSWGFDFPSLDVEVRGP